MYQHYALVQSSVESSVHSSSSQGQIHDVKHGRTCAATPVALDRLLRLFLVSDLRCLFLINNHDELFETSAREQEQPCSQEASDELFQASSCGDTATTDRRCHNRKLGAGPLSDSPRHSIVRSVRTGRW